jgi:hypothetical protein
MRNIKPGDLITFDIIGKRFTNENFSTGGSFLLDDNELEFYRYVDIENFPSFNDFKGDSSILTHGCYGLVIKEIGRPWKIQAKNSTWEQYDVFEVLTFKLVLIQAFRFNLKKVF